jgi:hypothetical protein
MTNGTSHGFSVMKANRAAVFPPMKRGNSKLAKDKKRPKTPSTIFQLRNRFSALNPTASFVLPIPSVNPYFRKVGIRKLPVTIAPPVNHTKDETPLRPDSLI